LGREVVEKQDGIEELGEIFDADNGNLFEDFTGNVVVARGFFGIEMVDGKLDIGIGETGIGGSSCNGVPKACRMCCSAGAGEVLGGGVKVERRILGVRRMLGLS
jgi:hypothetical protein